MDWDYALFKDLSYVALQSEERVLGTAGDSVLRDASVDLIRPVQL